MANTIVLKGDPIQKEEKAGSAITPGELLRFNDSGNLIPHDDSSTFAQSMFALANDSFGEDISDDYESGDQVQYVVADSGDEIYAWLATGNDVSKGDALESDGSGALQSFSGSPITGIVYALEDLNNTSGSRSRIKVEVA